MIIAQMCQSRVLMVVEILQMILTVAPAKRVGSQYMMNVKMMSFGMRNTEIFVG